MSGLPPTEEKLRFRMNRGARSRKLGRPSAERIGPTFSIHCPRCWHWESGPAARHGCTCARDCWMNSSAYATRVSGSEDLIVSELVTCINRVISVGRRTRATE